MTAPAACPSCGSALRPGQPWCTLCYADLRPPPEPAPLPPAPMVERAPVTLPLGLEPEPATSVGAAPTWPCTACGTANPFDLDACASCGQGFLAGARDQEPLLVLPVVGDLTRLGRGQRLGLAAGLVLAFLALVLLVGLLVG